MRLANSELYLLIKSRYPVVYLESIDEGYVFGQIQKIARQLRLVIFHWSVTDGLKRFPNEASYYRTNEPGAMLKTGLELLRTNSPECLFVLKDFEKHLGDPLVMRLFRDLINRIKETRSTVVMISASYALPSELEPYTTHIIGGFPSQEELREIIEGAVEEMKRSGQIVEVDAMDQDIDGLARALCGLSAQQARNVINRCILEDGVLNSEDRGRIEQFKKEIFDREGILEFCISEQKSNIADFDNLKVWLSERKACFDSSTGLPPPKGVLLMGVQGCGKSMAVKVIANELGLALYRLDISSLYSKYIGETEQNLRRALLTVEKLSPLCLWLDEIEKNFAASSGDTDGGVSQRILGTFLTWMQERKAGCFLAATANNISLLPPELMRKGRFDEIFFVDLPDEAMRRQIFKIHLEKRSLRPESFDCGLLAKRSPDFSGAEIEQAIISAMYRAMRARETLTTAHIADRLDATRPLALVMREEVNALREWARQRTIPA